MLRHILHGHLHPRLETFFITTSGGNAVAFQEGVCDMTGTESAAGLPVLTLKQPYNRQMLVFGTAGSISGAYVTQASATTGGVASLRLNNNSGTASDGLLQGLIIGWRSADVSRVLGQRVLASERRQRLVGGIISSAGVVTFGTSDFSCTKAATGTYDLTFKHAGAQAPVIICTTSSVGVTARAARTNGRLSAGGAATGTFGGRIFIYDEAGSLADSEFHIIVSQNDIKDDHGGALSVVQNPQRSPVVKCGQFIPGVTPSVSIHPTDFTIVRNGTGDYTLTLLFPARQIPVCIATANNARVSIVSITSSTFRLRISDATNTATDATSVDFLLLATNDPCQY